MQRISGNGSSPGHSAAEAKYRSLFDSLDVGFCIIEVLFDEQGLPVDYEFLEVNRAFEAQTGLVSAVGRRVREMVPGHEQFWMDTYGRIARTGEPERFEHRADALGRWYEVYAFPIGEPEQHQVGVLFNDVRARKQSEEALRVSEARLATALAIARLGTFDWNLLTNEVTLDDRSREIFGFAPEMGLHAQDVFDRIHPEDFPRVYAEAQGSREQLTPLETEYRLLLPNGAIRTILSINHVIASSDGSAERMFGVFRDMTERRRAEEELQRARDEARRILGTITDGFLVFDREWRFTYANSAAERMLGMRREELLGHNHWELFPATLGTVVEHEYRRAVRERTATEFEFIYEPWNRWFSVNSYPNPDGGLTNYFRDITARKQSEAALRASEAQYRVLIESLPQLVWSCLPDGRCDYLSRQWVAYTGLPEAEQLDLNWLDLVIHPEDRIRTREHWLGAVAGLHAYDIEYRIRSANGTYRWFQTRGVPLRDEQGAVVKWFGTCTDIDDRIRTGQELQKVNRELEEFAYVSSHDLQEPLRMVNIFSNLLVRRYGDGAPEAKQYADFIQQGVTRMETLLKDLLTYSRTVHPDEAPVNAASLSEALTEALSVLESRVHESHAVITAEALPSVRGEMQQMAHVFQNLLANSLKYRKPDVAPEIHVSAERHGPEWVICVRDNGIGFEPQYAERIFGLFKRLHKDEYPGTGLGLAICHRIIERYGGHIWAQGKPGQGAIFWFSLPAVDVA